MLIFRVKNTTYQVTSLAQGKYLVKRVVHSYGKWSSIGIDPQTREGDRIEFTRRGYFVLYERKKRVFHVGPITLDA